MFRSGRTHPAHAQSSGSETSLRIRFLAGYIIGTLESRFRKRQRSLGRASSDACGRRSASRNFRSAAGPAHVNAPCIRWMRQQAQIRAPCQAAELRQSRSYAAQKLTECDWQFFPRRDGVIGVPVRARGENPSPSCPRRAASCLCSWSASGRGKAHASGVLFKAENPSTGHLPNRIFLYRYPILYFWAGRQVPLDAIISHVLVHEIGHHFGLSDEDMRVIEGRE